MGTKARNTMKPGEIRVIRVGNKTYMVKRKDNK